MKRKRGSYFPFVLALAISLAFASASSAADHPPAGTGAGGKLYLSVQTVQGWLKEGRPVTFLDVRGPEEYATAHLPNAINIYYSEVTAVAGRLLPGDQPIVLYCTHSAYRAPAAAKILREVGVGSAYVLEGGIVAWKAGGLTILAENLGEEPRILPPPNCICRKPEKT